MLSYRHSFHAGNFADVIKHIVLIEILEHLCRKDAPFSYVDTHAGAGLYDLESTHAMKLQEHRGGVTRLSPAHWPELARYFAILNTCNSNGALRFYPGSPLIARELMRQQDRAWLFELHPADFEALKLNTAGDRRIHVRRDDGFRGSLAVLPPQSRRGLILVDPPYELKSDFERVVKTVFRAWKKFSTGIYLVWYPVVQRRQVESMEAAWIASGIRNVQRFELGVTADSDARGLSAAGVFVVNPPWRLGETMAILLPRLVTALGRDAGAGFKADVLVGE